MKNMDFGNYLYQLRKDNNLTQRFVAYQLDVSDKAVSKWEMGKSKPDLDKLKLLSTLYNVHLNELLDIQKENKEVKISKIVLTGGPCAGKTTALTWINNYFSKRGYTVLFVPETATELITNGVAPWTCGTNYDYQTFQMKLQKVKEQIFDDAATKTILDIKYKKFSDIVGKKFELNDMTVIPIYHPSPISPKSYTGNIDIEELKDMI